MTLSSSIGMRDVSAMPFLNVRFRSYSQQLRPPATEENASPLSSMATTHIGGFFGCYGFTNEERTHRWFFTVILRFFSVEVSVVRFARENSW